MRQHPWLQGAYTTSLDNSIVTTQGYEEQI